VKPKTIAIALGILLSCSTTAGKTEENQPQIYLPRKVQVEQEHLTLGDISIISCDDDELSQKVSLIAVGRAPLLGESIVIDRRTVLSRLVASGIERTDARVTGARKVSVTRRETTIPSEDLLESAQKLLRTSRPGPKGVTWRLTRKIDDLVFPSERRDVKLRPHLVDTAGKNYVKVRVGAYAGEKEIAGSDLLFRIVYPHQQAVAVSPISPGEKITEQNAQVRTVLMDSAPREKFEPPFGMIAKKNVEKGNLIRPSILEKNRPALVIERNQTVEMKITGPGFKVSGIAKALQDGRVGQVIRVRNMDTKRTIAARVGFDGTVVPVIKR